MAVGRIYALIRTDDFSTSVRDFIGFYSSADLANKAAQTIRRGLPDFYNLHVETFPFDWMGLDQSELENNET